MPGPKLPPIEVSGEERAELERLRRHGTGQQLAERARIIVFLADGLNQSEVARTAGVHVDTVRKWPRRWDDARDVPLADLGIAARLDDAPRPGTPARITPEQVARIVALACEAPGARSATGARPSWPRRSSGVASSSGSPRATRPAS